MLEYSGASNVKVETHTQALIIHRCSTSWIFTYDRAVIDRSNKAAREEASKLTMSISNEKDSPLGYTPKHGGRPTFAVVINQGSAAWSSTAAPCRVMAELCHQW